MDIQSLFTPYDNADLCLWFYFLSIYFFTLLIVSIVATIIMAITSKKINFVFIIYTLIASLTYGFVYFQNRLLYSMCVKSV